MTINLRLPIMRLPHGLDLPLPAYATHGAAGMDVAAAVDRSVILGAGERLAIPTGFAMAVPAGYEAQIRPRSGLALKHGVTVANAPGTIDSDYRGEVAILLVNLGAQDFTIERGMRIAQMVVAPVTQVTPVATESLPDTDRGDGGFGSTGY
ncbi:MAG: dUTP diphosphatase [Candidatus Puniceispirillum sp.]|jgi:dUTP pyrophosphatase